MSNIVKFNVNHNVTVRLNDDGVKIYQAWREKNVGCTGDNKLSKGDVLETQLWILMRIFGPPIRMWTGTGFENNEISLLLEGSDEIIEGGGEIS